MVDVTVHDSAEAAAIDVAESIRDHVASCVANATACRLGLATGGTPLPVYRHLIEMVTAGKMSFHDVVTFNLDEYIGLTSSHPHSYHAYMRSHLFDAVGLDASRTHLPLGSADDPDAEAARYESTLIASGGVTMQLLGIGRNGHIGFNEPGSEHDSVTRVVDLADSTIAANARYFDDPANVPRQAITMGIGTILRSHEIILMATGASKADAIRGAIRGPVEPSNPASSLQTHAHVRWVLDTEAASKL